MTPATVNMIVNLIPLAEKVIFSVGGKLVELNTQGVGKEDLIKAIEESKNWPDLKFVSGGNP